jgi:hypothetical protein
MEHVLADHGLRITCLTDADRFDELEEGILCDGWGEGIAHALHPWRGRLSLVEQDVIVLVTGNDDDRPVGLVAASQRATQHEPFLLLEAAYVSGTVRHPNLLQRMIAFSILSLARSDATPTLIAACSRSEAYAKDIRELGACFTAAAAFPDPDAPAIDLAIASTARRIARTVRPEARYAAGSGTFYAASDRDYRFPQNTLVLFDLATSDEATIAADARRVFRERSPRRPVYAAGAAGEWRGTKRPLPDVASSRAPSQIGRPRR